MRDELFGATVQKTHHWVNDVAKELGTEDKHRAYLALRAVMHALRDRLPDVESAQFAAQLPMLLRGVYYEGYNPARTPHKERHLEEFLEHIMSEFPGDITEDEAREFAVAVMATINRHVTEGEVEDVRSVLPKEIAALWPSDGEPHHHEHRPGQETA